MINILMGKCFYECLVLAGPDGPPLLLPTIPQALTASTLPLPHVELEANHWCREFLLTCVDF